MIGRLLSSWEGPFSGAGAMLVLVLGRVTPKLPIYESPPTLDFL